MRTHFPQPGSNRPIWRLCNSGHSWLATPYVRTQDHSCAACKGKEATPDNNLALVRPDLLHTWHYNEIRSNGNWTRQTCGHSPTESVVDLPA
ncbi:zinc-ribbon domain-containing protein [Pseudarthrobacter scleromae]|uniref:zinc-ribbon domain-containing protein n=1 Tax=Pseudarthrobacter scleromae TaxID=158897 RepID=UPI0036275486